VPAPSLATSIFDHDPDQRVDPPASVVRHAADRRGRTTMEWTPSQATISPAPHQDGETCSAIVSASEFGPKRGAVAIDYSRSCA
jgi:hypothetical protein